MSNDVLSLMDAPTAAQIFALEAAMRELPQIDVKTDHTFGPGFYARTIHLPAGAVLTGKTHATEHIFMLTDGEMTIVSDGQKARIKAPYQAVCQPGIKRGGVAHTDCICSNVHITDKTDLAELEAELIVQDLLEADAGRKEIQ